jgi:hypothetical protein
LQLKVLEVHPELTKLGASLKEASELQRAHDEVLLQLQVQRHGDAEWAPEPVWTTWKRESSCPYRDSNSDPSVVQPVVSHYTD